jgi:hypothetical protein
MGIIYDMTNEDYHATAGISSSAVKSVYKKSLAHWKGEKRVQSLSFTMGSAVHALLLEETKPLVVKGPKTKVSKAFKEMGQALGDDQILLTEVEYNVAHCIARGALNDPICKAALRHPSRLNEVSLFVECPRTGLRLKTRPDLAILSEGALYDVKTTVDASPRGFASECNKYSYGVQGAFYLYVCQLAGWDVSKFYFIAVEKSAPYVAHMHLLGPELLTHSTEQMFHTLEAMAYAQSQDDYGTGWGDYSILEKPKWL